MAISLPDNLTTWQVQARGTTTDTLVGQATDHLTVSKPLLVRPVTPRFFTAGDEATVAAVVHNNTDSSFDAEVRLQAGGASLNSPASQTISIPGRGSARIEWTLSIGSTDGVDLTFTAAGGGYRDATTPTIGTAQGGQLPVFRYQAPTTAGTSGWLPEADSRTESVSLPPRYIPEAGELLLSLEPSPGAIIRRGLVALEGHRYESTEYLASRLVVNASVLQTLASVDGGSQVLQAQAEEEARKGIRALLDRQNDDGGWGWWPQSASNTYLTAYALHALQVTGEAGVMTKIDGLTEAESYLRGTLVNPAALDSQALTQQAFVLWILARNDGIEASSLRPMVSERDRLSPYGQALLIAALSEQIPTDADLPALISSLESAAVLSPSGTHWDRTGERRHALGSSVSVTAQAVRALLLSSPNSPSVEDAVRWLILSRTEAGEWRSTHDTAWALQALLHWIRTSGSWEADFTYGVNLNGETLAEGSFDEAGLTNAVRVTRPVEDLKADEPNALIVQRGEGNGTLSYTAHLTVYRPVEAVPSSSRGLSVERSYYLDDGSCDFDDSPCQQVEAAESGDNLLVRLTLVVPNDSYYVAIEDRLPAGLEPIDPGFLTSSSRTPPFPDRLHLGWLGWRFSRVEIDDERVALFADFLPRGTYTYIYRLHASFPGSYRTLPARAWLAYFPEVYGQTAGQIFTIEP